MRCNPQGGVSPGTEHAMTRTHSSGHSTPLHGAAQQ